MKHWLPTAPTIHQIFFFYKRERLRESRPENIGLRERIEQAVGCVRVGGRVVVVGLGPDEVILPPPTQIVRTELSFLGSYGSTASEIQSVIDLVTGGKLNLSDSITERFPLEEVSKGLDHLHKKIGNPIRIVVMIG